jgi:hypothetical protein
MPFKRANFSSNYKYKYSAKRLMKSIILRQRRREGYAVLHTFANNASKKPICNKILVRNNLMDKDLSENIITKGNIQQLPIFSQRSKKSFNPPIRSGYFPSKSVT